MADAEKVRRGLQLLRNRLQEQQRLIERIHPEVEHALTRMSLTPTELAQIQRLAREYREEEERRNRHQELWHLIEGADDSPS